MRQLAPAWWTHRVARVLSPSYGHVGPLGVPRRAAGFVGSLGVSFLTG